MHINRQFALLGASLLTISHPVDLFLHITSYNIFNCIHKWGVHLTNQESFRILKLIFETFHLSLWFNGTFFENIISKRKGNDWQSEKWDRNVRLIIEQESDHWWRFVGYETHGQEYNEVYLFKEFDSISPFDRTFIFQLHIFIFAFEAVELFADLSYFLLLRISVIIKYHWENKADNEYSKDEKVVGECKFLDLTHHHVLSGLVKCCTMWLGVQVTCWLRWHYNSNNNDS